MQVVDGIEGEIEHEDVVDAEDVQAPRGNVRADQDGAIVVGLSKLRVGLIWFGLVWFSLVVASGD